MSRCCALPSSAALAFENFTVQRASRSFWRSFAGLSFHASGTLPALISAFGIAVALLRRRHDRGIDDLAAHCEIAGPGEVLVEAGKQVLHRAGLREVLAEQPYRLGVWHPVAKAKLEEAHERQPILDLELGLVVGQAVERLQDHDPEHQHRIVARPAALGAIRPLQRLGQRLAENLPRHHSVQLLQRIAGLAQPHIALVNVPKPRLSPHPSPPGKSPRQ